MRESLIKLDITKKFRVIIDTDAACEIDDQYAIAHALMSDKIKNLRLLLTIFLVLFLIVYWIIFTVILNYNETFPYAFSNNYFR